MHDGTLESLTDTVAELGRYAAFVSAIDPGIRLRLMAFRVVTPTV